MGVMRLVLFFIIGWILWRIIRVMMRMGASSRGSDAGIDINTPPGPGSSNARRTIRDAEFEDLTPPPPTGDAKQEKPRA
ncbi:hypothetical protein ANRL2_02672 [Anaerolineae bacterium]|nr:hypothetical protein ANRL2_02672 [Anaerolineae bacterium]